MIINIKVKLGSGKQEIIKLNDKEYEVYVKQPPENNKANIEIIKLLRRYFKKDIRIVKGFKTRKKLVEIKGIDKQWEND